MIALVFSYTPKDHGVMHTPPNQLCLDLAHPGKRNGFKSKNSDLYNPLESKIAAGRSACMRDDVYLGSTPCLVTKINTLLVVIKDT